jgi:hypothetical protein
VQRALTDMDLCASRPGLSPPRRWSNSGESHNFVTGPADCVHGSYLDPTGETGKTGETSAGGFWPVIVTAGPFLHRRSQRRGRRVNRVSFRRFRKGVKALKGSRVGRKRTPLAPLTPGQSKMLPSPALRKAG